MNDFNYTVLRTLSEGEIWWVKILIGAYILKIIRLKVRRLEPNWYERLHMPIAKELLIEQVKQQYMSIRWNDCIQKVQIDWIK